MQWYKGRSYSVMYSQHRRTRAECWSSLLCLILTYIISNSLCADEQTGARHEKYCIIFFKIMLWIQKLLKCQLSLSNSKLENKPRYSIKILAVVSANEKLPLNQGAATIAMMVSLRRKSRWTLRFYSGIEEFMTLLGNYLVNRHRIYA